MTARTQVRAVPVYQIEDSSLRHDAPGQFMKERGRPRPRVAYCSNGLNLIAGPPKRHADGGVRAPFPAFMNWGRSIPVLFDLNFLRLGL